MTLKRRTPLRANPAKVAAWVRRSRKPLPKLGAKAKREAPTLDAAREALRARSGGQCECARYGTFPGFDYPRPCARRGPHEGTDAHHVWPEDRDAGRHDPDRMVWLCRTAHNWLHARPQLGRECGLLRPLGRDTVVRSAP